MSTVSVAKLVLALAGIVVFLLGIRSGDALLRWTGTALVVIAWLLRFVDRTSAPSRRGHTTAPTEEE